MLNSIVNFLFSFFNLNLLQKDLERSFGLSLSDHEVSFYFLIFLLVFFSIVVSVIRMVFDAVFGGNTPKDNLGKIQKRNTSNENQRNKKSGLSLEQKLGVLDTSLKTKTRLNKYFLS